MSRGPMTGVTSGSRYDSIGTGYAARRREDPRLRVLIHEALGDARTVLNVHHWDAEREAGVRELRRVARGPVVIVTFDPAAHAATWLLRDYLPEVAELDLRTFPPIGDLMRWLGDGVSVTEVPVCANTPDHTLASFWAHPERVLDPAARAATSGFARMPAHVVDRAVAAVARDLRSGVWDARHGGLRELTELDAGMRLVVARPG